MRLHENWELFSDALQAASQPVEDGGLGIKSIFIEKDYWICRSLSLMAANDKDARAIFKGGTSLTKAYGIGSRFSKDRQRELDRGIRYATFRGECSRQS